MTGAAQHTDGVFAALFGDLVRFPVWWYAQGLRYVSRALLQSIQNQAARTGIGVWFHNIFVPMYGQYDWQGRLISFLVRGAQVAARGGLLCVWAFIVLCAFVAYVAFPTVVLAFILFHLTNGFFGLYA